MNPQDASNTQPTGNRIFLNGKQLAEVLDVAPPSLSEAAKKGYQCGGYPVDEWAVLYDSGRIKGYDVPDFLVENKASKQEKRVNPEENTPNLANMAPNKANKSQDQAQSVIHNYSLLPEGEDYVRPAGMLSLPLVLNKALDKDSLQSRAVIGVLSTLLGAITGHAITNNTMGAGVGACSGLAITLLMYNYVQPANNISQTPAITFDVVKHKLEALLADKANQSGT